MSVHGNFTIYYCTFWKPKKIKLTDKTDQGLKLFLSSHTYLVFPLLYRPSFSLQQWYWYLKPIYLNLKLFIQQSLQTLTCIMS